MRRLLLLISTLFLAALPAPAQTALPGSFAGWTGTVNSAITPSQLYNYDDGSLDVRKLALDEYGVTGAAACAYTRGKDKLLVVLYRMKDPSGAYGEFTFLRSLDMAPAKLGENAAISSGEAVVQTGSFVLDVRGTGLPRYQKDLQDLVSIVSPHAEHGPLPFLPQHLPASGMIAGSDHYVLGPQVLGDLLPSAQNALPELSKGFSQGAEAELAKYRLKTGEVTLLLVDFPTPPMASQQLEVLKKKLDVNGENSGGALPPVFAKRTLTTLCLAFGTRSHAEAEILLDQVHSGTELTWNEPSFEATQPGWVVILLGTFVGTGIICVFAMIASLAFGGARLLIKRMLPDRVFDRSSEMQILQLGLSSKPINAEDFYGIGRSSRK